MSQFMNNDIIEHFHWCHHQSPIDVNITARCACSPALMLCTQMDGCWMDMKKRLIIGYTLLQFFYPLLPVPSDGLFFWCLRVFLMGRGIEVVCAVYTLLSGDVGVSFMRTVV